MRSFLLLILVFTIRAQCDTLGSAPTLKFGGSISQSRIMQLLGTTPLKDGPNCFNAAAYVRGFVDSLFLTNSGEMDFYLTNLCELKSDGIRAGDILAVVSDQGLQHAAIAMDNEVIFEKATVSGREGKADPEWVAAHPEEGNYRTIRRKDSRWFDGVSKYATSTRIEVHRCVPPEVARERLAELRKLPAIQIADRIFRNFDRMATRKDKLDWNKHAMLRMDIFRFAQELDKLQGSSVADQYSNAVASSIWQNLLYLDQETKLSPDFWLAFGKLTASRKLIEAKILAQQIISTSSE